MRKRPKHIEDGYRLGGLVKSCNVDNNLGGEILDDPASQLQAVMRTGLFRPTDLSLRISVSSNASFIRALRFFCTDKTHNQLLQNLDRCGKNVAPARCLRRATFPSAWSRSRSPSVIRPPARFSSARRRSQSPGRLG